MQIPILNGIYSDERSDLRTAYPRNLIPVPSKQGISGGYLKPSEGIVSLVENTVGVDRGGIEWKGLCYRVCGTKLILVSSTGNTTQLGDVGGEGLVSFDYSFDRLAINSGESLYYYDGVSVDKVTDSDLGDVLDMIWVDGMFMTTDGEYVVVTDLDDPFAVNQFKYGSSEVDPDDIVAIKKLRNEPHIINRHTIEVFDNIGGSGFPFQRIDGAQITKGAIGTNACCVFLNAIAFIGGARNEQPSVWLGAGGNVQKLATREIDQALKNYTEEELSGAHIETRMADGHEWLYIHLPDRTYVYDASASASMGTQVWFELGSGSGHSTYLARGFVWCYDKWIVGHPLDNKIGYMSDSIGSHWGDVCEWEFGTHIIYNGSSAMIIHELELVSLTGRNGLSEESFISSEYSTDGMNWSNPRSISLGWQGQTNKRISWFGQGLVRSWRVQRFKGNSSARASFVRLEAIIEPLGI